MVLKSVIKTFLIIITLQIALQAKIIDINHIVQQAQKSNKHLFLWLHKTDCGYCENMREFTLENEVIKQFIEKKFIFVHINVYEKDYVLYEEFKGNGLEFAKEIGYNFYPSSLFFDNEGEIIFAEVGFIENKNFSNEERFFKILNYIDSKSYLKMDYDEFKFKTKKEF